MEFELIRTSFEYTVSFIIIVSVCLYANATSQTSRVVVFAIHSSTTNTPRHCRINTMKREK